MVNIMCLLPIHIWFWLKTPCDPSVLGVKYERVLSIKNNERLKGFVNLCDRQSVRITDTNWGYRGWCIGRLPLPLPFHFFVPLLICSCCLCFASVIPASHIIFQMLKLSRHEIFQHFMGFNKIVSWCMWYIGVMPHCYVQYHEKESVMRYSLYVSGQHWGKRTLSFFFFES